MKRVSIILVVLAVVSGCMAVEADSIEDPPYARPQRFPALKQSQSWSNVPQSAKAAAQNTNPKSDNTIVKAAYSEPKPPPSELPPASLGMIRLTNNKRITFRYQSSDTASPDASHLEIWGTTDLRSWKKYEATSRPPSSLAVEVKDEGLYGFTIIAHGKDDSSKDQPPANDPPQVWVAVDLTNPIVELIDAEMSTQAQNPAVLVRWNAKDRNFGPQPISVLYAEHPEGPWRPLAANLENSGHYEGTLPTHLGDNVHVRVQAADMMGNVGLSQTTALRTSRTSTSPARKSQPAVSILSVTSE